MSLNEKMVEDEINESTHLILTNICQLSCNICLIPTLNASLRSCNMTQVCDCNDYILLGLTSPCCLQEEGQEVSPRRVRCCSGQHPTVLSWKWWDDFGSGVS